MCLLKILCRGCPFGKYLSMVFRNFLPRLVLTLAYHGILPDECGHSLTIRNSVVAIKQ